MTADAQQGIKLGQCFEIGTQKLSDAHLALWWLKAADTIKVVAHRDVANPYNICDRPEAPRR